MAKKIVVHSGIFHADDALSVFFLLNTAEFENAQIIRTRDPKIIETADCVADVGGVYDHEKRRYDHHQPTFNVKFPNSSIQCASCGTIYIHFGQEVLTNLLQKSGRNPDSHFDYLYKAMYTRFIKEIDAVDNGISQNPPNVPLVYEYKTDIASRISYLNPHWKTPNPNPDAQFFKAVELIGNEFKDLLFRIYDSEIAAIDVAIEAYQKRFEVDPSGQIVLSDFTCGIEATIKNLELEDENRAKDQNTPIPNKILYTVKSRDDGAWSVKALGTGNGFELRKPLPFPGLRDQELSDACGIPGGIFVHKSGFLAGFKEKEQALQFAKYALNN